MTLLNETEALKSYLEREVRAYTARVRPELRPGALDFRTRLCVFCVCPGGWESDQIKEPRLQMNYLTR